METVLTAHTQMPDTHVPAESATRPLRGDASRASAESAGSPGDLCPSAESGPSELYASDVESPIGRLRLVSSARGLAYLGLPACSGRGLSGWLRQHARGERVVDDEVPNRGAVDQLVEYLAGRRPAFSLRLDLRGTPFQQAVWKLLLDIPFGETRSYLEIARTLGRPSATRAVGAANGANPIPIVVPCHRVIASSGSLGGYAGGLELKRWLLSMEQSGPGRDRLI